LKITYSVIRLFGYLKSRIFVEKNHANHGNQENHGSDNGDGGRNVYVHLIGK